MKHPGTTPPSKAEPSSARLVAPPSAGTAFVGVWLLTASRSNPEDLRFCFAGIAAALIAAGALCAAGRLSTAPSPRAAAVLPLFACLPAISPCIGSPVAGALLWTVGGAAAGTVGAVFVARVCSHDLLRAMTALAFAAAASFAANLALFALSPAPESGMPLVIVLCSAGAFLACLGDAGEPPSSAASAAARQLPAPQADFYLGITVPFALLALFFGISLGFPKGILGESSLGYFAASSAAAMAAAALICAWLRLRMGNASAPAFGGVVLALVIALLIVLFVDRDDKTVLLALLTASRHVSFLLVALLALALTKRGDHSAFPAASLSFGIFSLFYALGLCAATSPEAGAFLLSFPHEGIYLLMACMFAVFGYGLNVVSGFYRDAEGKPRRLTVVMEARSVDARCEEISAEFSLTERETEIIKLLCKGWTRSYIAESLYLSENTVKWYCRQIYRKLGIHRKQELLVMVGAAEKADGGASEK